jgi:hypothetical protein
MNNEKINNNCKIMIKKSIKKLNTKLLKFSIFIFKYPWMLNNPWHIDEKTNKINYKILLRLIESCGRLPKFISSPLLIFTDLLSMWSTTFFSTIWKISLNGYIVEGKEKYDGTNIKILYISDKHVDHFLFKLILLNRYTINKIGNINLWNLRKSLKKIRLKVGNVDMTILKSHIYYSNYLINNGFIVIPEWISMRLDISNSIKDIHKNISKSIKEDIRKYKKYNFSYEFSSDPNMLKLFYNKMYKPSTLKKYGDIAECVNYLSFLHIFERNSAKLMLINQADKHVSGSLIEIRNGIARGIYSGVLNGNSEYLKKGVYAAIYNFSILYAKEKNAQIIHMGKCRSFFNDGLLQYKRKWGAEIINPKKEISYNEQDTYAISIHNYSIGIKKFLLNNPFIYLDNKNNLNGIIFTNENCKSGSEEDRHINKIYRISNIKKFAVIHPEDLHNAIK